MYVKILWMQQTKTPNSLLIFGRGCGTILQRVGVEGGSSISADNLTLTHEPRVSFATTRRYAGFVLQERQSSGTKNKNTDRR